jgi:hypothetical protein
MACSRVNFNLTFTWWDNSKMFTTDFTQTSCKVCDWVEMAQEKTPLVSFSDNGYEQHGI